MKKFNLKDFTDLIAKLATMKIDEANERVRAELKALDEQHNCKEVGEA